MILDLLVRFYARQHNYPGVPVRVLTPLRIITRRCARYILPRHLAKSHRTQSRRQVPVIVSFTSFPARIDTAWQVVECMLRQTCQPEKIILWLSRQQFPTPESIPQSLREREGEIFSIRLVDGDIRSHKKYYYAAREYPQSLIFLVDDDIYYDTRLLERTMAAYDKDPSAIICNYGYHIAYNSDGSPKPYLQWPHEYYAFSSANLFFGSGGGTLFRPSDLHPDLTDITTARQLCPLADDVWLNAIVRLSGKKIVILRNGLVLPVYTPNNVELSTQNQWQSGNDEQIAAVNAHYQSSIFNLQC